MRVAIPTTNESIEQSFSGAKEFTVYEVEIELVKSKEVVPLRGREFAVFLTEEGINGVICGKIRSFQRNILRTKRIELIYGVAGNADEIMIRYLSGERLGNIDENAHWRWGKEEME